VLKWNLGRNIWKKKYAGETNDLDKHSFRLIRELINARLDKEREIRIIEKLDDFIHYHEIIYLISVLFVFVMGVIAGVLLVVY